ncbi:hypothetical protein PPYR_01954 [Photinus pyralis]|uniref:Uncharacterized protein n=1 Tax=Photinus pyralis TaxID=7054 RepID=A0A1Y1LRM0_PHOPY|nr:uncharacterized protein LOC116170095 [Photinus pyralis]XP_031342158.1 uncharacterized protein LOC116170095 [Photinus pyralis]XP_031342164.1 uncharacterized protein LOC116170095 [Photinus pyralis]KAB0804984.1 hypothetical protein PPYR_01954 [Photinus pyralis]
MQSRFFVTPNMIFKLILFAFLISTSYQTDIELAPLDNETTTALENVTQTATTTNTTTTSTTTQIPLTIREKCLIGLNVSEDYSDTYGAVGETNETYLNFISCYWKNQKLLGENGEINFILLKEMISQAARISVDITDVPLSNAWIIANEIMEECKETNGSTHGEKAVKMRNCMYGKLLYQRDKEFLLKEYEDIPYLEVSEEACVVQLKLDPLLIEDLNRHYLVVEDNVEFKNFLECYWKDVEYMDKNGTLNIPLLQIKLNDDIEMEFLSRSKAPYLTDILTNSILKSCKTIKGDGQLVSNMYAYICRRLPYFSNILLHE